MAAAVVATCNPISYNAVNSGVQVNDPFVLFTTPQQNPVLIETVHLFCDYGNGQPAGDMWILRLLNQAGLILHSQATPAFSVNDIPGDVEVCWSRGASEMSYTPVLDPTFQDNGNFTGFATVPLPDLILDTSSVVQMQLIQNIFGGGSSALTVTSPIVTYDDGGQSAAASTAFTVLPLVVPQTG